LTPKRFEGVENCVVYSLTPMRNYPLILLFLVLVPGSAIHAQLRNVELSAKDIIAIYDVPVQATPAHKFEWNVDGEKYFRVVVEESDPKKPDWKPRDSYAFGMPVHKFILTCLVLNPTEVNREINTSGGAWIVRTRIGGEGKNQSGWIGADFRLAAPVFGCTIGFDGSDPNHVFSLTAPNVVYRLRLEASDTPFAK
jgi:hypothetical protein